VAHRLRGQFVLGQLQPAFHTSGHLSTFSRRDRARRRSTVPQSDRSSLLTYRRAIAPLTASKSCLERSSTRKVSLALNSFNHQPILSAELEGGALELEQIQFLGHVLVQTTEHYPAMSNDVLLNLWQKDLHCVPDWVWERTTLETLILADNGLIEVSEKLGELTHLRTLDLGHNQLVSLPESLGELTEMINFLYLHDNRLTNLPSSIRRLQRLRYLNISENSICVFPESICSLSNLIELRATDNQLTRLPDGVARLSRLRELHLRNNQLTTLPSAVGELAELRQL
jgi:hypothetical protein